ncbi:SusC/RagA family TonB-linked outer membrane protein [Fodinibius sp. Rm-B-1B1-1]|uniref:SusC/RagA family TonB-linked outer membrane protein n=1 Tax=Fodinibius alkaliphilus TaxID=3140241 RepID=UPI00315ABACB
MLRKLLSTAIFTLFLAATTLAQDGTVTGTVTDAETGETLPGVNVVINELQTGASTDAEGVYTISGVPSGTYTIQASFIGYRTYTQEIEVGAGETTHNIQMRSDVLGLDEVVVSALGFESDRDESGVSTSNIGGETVGETGEENLLNSLSGLASGMRVTSSGGDPGAGSYILIRGQSTITGDTQPLFVIDGVPVENSTLGQGIDGVAQQSRINDLNPDDIESIEVLKGASAAALWGSRAINGVVVVKTKAGQTSGDKPVNVSFKSSVKTSELNKTVPLQTQFGQGSGGAYSYGSSDSWGDYIPDREGGEDLQVTSPTGPFGNLYNGYGVDNNDNEYYVIPSAGATNSNTGEVLGPHGGKRSTQTYDHGDEVFQNGLTIENSLSLSGGDQDGTYYLSIGNVSQEGIIRNNSNYNRTNVRFTADQQFGDLNLSGSAAYNKNTSDRIQQGSNLSGIFLGGLRTSPDFNNSVYELDYYDTAGNLFPDKHRAYRNPIASADNPGYDNPFWTIENNENSSVVNRLIGKVEASYDPTSWFNLTGRVGLDRYQDRRYSFFPVYNATYDPGQMTEETISEYQINTDIIARATHQLNEDFSGSALVGFNFNHREFDNVGATAENFTLPGDFRDLENTAPDQRYPFNGESTVRTAAVYSELKLNAYDQLFLTVTGRGETASTFGEEASSTFFYPSVSAAWQFTDLDALSDNSILSFGKLRASWGQVGRQPGPYLTITDYVPASFGTGWGPALSASNYGGGYVRSTNQGNANLKPETKTEMEAGLDLRFFDDRVRPSVTFYQNETTDAIFSVDVAASTGFAGQTANAATLENKGVEVELGVDWIASNDFNWTTNLHWSTNENEVTDLQGTESIFLAGFAGTSSRAVEGEALGVLWGVPYARDESGNLELSNAGFPTVNATEGVLGDPNPDWIGGVTNTFNYKGVELSFMIDIKHGGDIWNGTKGALYTFGTHEDVGTMTTVSANEAQNLVTYGGSTIADLANSYDNGSYNGYAVQNDDGSYTFRGRVHDFGGGEVALDESWYTDLGGGFGPVAEEFIQDGGYVRLKQVKLGYTLSNEWLSSKTGLSSVNLSAQGNNLLLFTDYDGIDPATNLTGPSNGRGLDYFNNPNTRSLIFTLRVNY